MNFPEIEKVIKHLQKTCTCLQCKSKYDVKDIHTIATTKIEGLFEVKCKKCNCSTIVTVLLAKGAEIKDAKIESAPKRKHRKISQNDVLDIKNFLSRFDGNFKRIFTQKK